MLNLKGVQYYNSQLTQMLQCPVTGLEMNGRVKFVFSFTTGKVGQ